MTLDTVIIVDPLGRPNVGPRNQVGQVNELEDTSFTMVFFQYKILDKIDFQALFILIAIFSSSVLNFYYSRDCHGIEF